MPMCSACDDIKGPLLAAACDAGLVCITATRGFGFAVYCVNIDWKLFVVCCDLQVAAGKGNFVGCSLPDPPGSHAYAKASCLRVYLLTNLVLPNSYGVPARLFLCRCVALTVQPRLIIWHESLSGLHGSLYVTCSAGLLVQFCSYFAIEDVGGVVEVLSCGAGVRHPALQV